MISFVRDKHSEHVRGLLVALTTLKIKFPRKNLKNLTLFLKCFWGNFIFTVDNTPQKDTEHVRNVYHVHI